MQLAQANINFVSNMARSVASRRKVGDMKHAGSMKEELTDSERMAKMRVSQMRLQTKLRDLDVGNPNDKTKIAITKNDLENIQMKMDQLKIKEKVKSIQQKHYMRKLLGYKRKQIKQVCLTQYLNKYITEEWLRGKVVIDQVLHLNNGQWLE